jgi:hypothetical protein
MGNSSIFCCPDKEFIAYSDLDSGNVSTTVEYTKGSSLRLFCDYGNLSALKKLKEVSPEIANEKYLFYKGEIGRMLSFLSVKDELMVDKLIVYKLKFSGMAGYDAHSVSKAKIFIEFTLNAICKRNDKIEEMSYIYRWRKDGLSLFGDPKQTVEFKTINNNLKIYVGGHIVI